MVTQSGERERLLLCTGWNGKHEAKAFARKEFLQTWGHQARTKSLEFTVEDQSRAGRLRGDGRVGLENGKVRRIYKLEYV